VVGQPDAPEGEFVDPGGGDKLVVVAEVVPANLQQHSPAKNLTPAPTLAGLRCAYIVAHNVDDVGQRPGAAGNEHQEDDPGQHHQLLWG
jgi:hypothetical protein